MAKRIRIIPWLDESQLNKQLDQLGKRKQKIKVDIDDGSISNTDKNIQQMNKSVTNSNTVFGKLRSTISNTFSTGKIAMTGYLMVLNELNKAGQNAKQTIQDIDKAITDLSIATNMSRKATAGLIKDYNDYAKILGSTTTQITSAADDYLRAGKSMSEAQALIQDSIMLSKLGQLDSSVATEDLLATMNGYEMSVEELERALDAMVAIDMEAATSSGDIATALKYCASSADVAGLSFNKLAAMIGQVQDKTQQSAETIGTFMNTLLSRYRDVKIGRFVDDDGESLSDVESVLGSLNIQLRDSKEEFRDFEAVIDEVAQSWNSYSSVQQAAIAKAFSGVRNQNRFIALMEGYNKTLELTEVAANSAGTAVEKFNSAYMNSLEAKQNTLQASFESMVINSDFDEIYSDILDATTALVDFINQTNTLKGVFAGLAVSSGIKFFLSVKTGVTEAYIALNKYANALNIVKQTNISTADFDKLLLLSNGLSDSQMRLLLSSKNLSMAQKELIITNSNLSAEEKQLQLQTLSMATAQTGLTSATTTLGNSFKALMATMAANPIMLITMLISGAVMAYQAYSRKVEEARQKTIDALEESSNAYKTAISDLEKLQKELQDTADKMAELETGGITLVEQEEYDRLVAVNEELERTIALKKINQQSSAREAASNAVKVYNNTFGGTTEPSQERVQSFADEELFGARLLAVNNKDINELLSAYLSLQDAIRNTKAEMDALVDKDDEESTYRLEELQRQLELDEEYLTDYSSLINEYSQTYQDILNGINAKKETGLELTASETKVYNNANTALDLISNTLLTVQERLDKLISKNEWEDSLTELFNSEKSLSEITDELSEQYPELINFLDETGISVDDLSEKFRTLGEVQDSVLADDNNMSASVSQLIDQLNTQLKPTFDSLKSAYQDIFTDNGFNLNAVDISMLEKIKSDIEELNNLEDVDININMDDFDTFAKILTDVNTTKEQAQQAFDDFATAIFNATFATQGITDETAQLVEQLLESLGVVNANEVAQYALNEAKAKAIIASYDLVNASEDEYAALLDEAVAAGIATQQVYKLIAAEIAFGNNDLSVEQKIDKLHALASAYGDTASAALATAIANDLASGHTDVDSAINDLMTQINSGLSKVDVDFSGIEKSAKKAGSSAGKSYAESFKDELKSTLSGITGLIDKQISSLGKQRDAAVKALEAERNAAIEAIEAEIDGKKEVIDGIQDEINAMKDANEERKRQLTLQQAQYDLERMQHQRTILQYSEEKGMHYVQDLSGTRDAKEKVENAKLDIEIANREKQIDLLEKEIDLLEKRKDAINDYYDQLIEDTKNYWDSLIESLEEYKSRWEELLEIEENAKLIVALRKLGIETDDILNMSGEAFDKFKDKYLSALTGMYSGNDEMLGAISESMGEFGESLPPVSQKIDTTAESMDNLSGSSSTANKNISDTAENLDTAATNAGALSDNLTKINTALSEEQTAFKDLKQTIDKVIEAINEKIAAIQEEQNAVGIATSTEISDFLLLRDKILEVKESINEVGTTVADLDLKTVDNITESFQHLYDAIMLVSDVLGSGIESGGEGVTNSISSAIQALNEISLEDGIIAQFNNLKIAIDDVTSAVGGGDRESSGGKNKYGKSGSIGKGSENGNDSLTGSIIDMGETTQETLGESGGEGAIGKFEEFGATIAEAESHVQGVIDKLNEVDGMHSDATITINIETNGSIPQFVEGTLGDVNFESGSFTAEYGKAHAEGYNGLPKAEKNALVSEYGQTEMTVFPNGETVITDSPTMMDLPKGTVIFNEEQTKKILDNKLSVSGTAHAQGTDDGVITLADGTVLRPPQPGDPMYDNLQKINAYFEKHNSDVNSLLTPVNTIQRDMEQMAKSISTVNNVSNSRIQQTVTQNITLNCPNVTNNSGIEYIQKELGHLSLMAMQESMKH